MVKFTGRSCMKEYIPKKPIKRGFKVWVRADSITGYVCNFEVYTGKTDSSETQLGPRVVKSLSQSLVGKHYHLYYDNFFSSVSLFQELLEDGLYACGTFRKDRSGVPEEIQTVQPRDLQRGEYVYRQNGSIVATVWRDRKLVYVMSTNCPATGDTQVRRKDKDGSTNLIPCPPNVVEYNKYMAGVDKADQLRGYYRVRTKSRKFYKYLFWFLFDCCTVNAFIVMKHFRAATDVTPRQGFKDFRVRLAEGLIGEYNSRHRYLLPQPIHVAAIDSLTPAPLKRRRLAIDSSSNDSSSVALHFHIKGSSCKCAYCWNVKDHRCHESSVHCRRCRKAFCIVSRDPPEGGPSCFERYHMECL